VFVSAGSFGLETGRDLVAIAYDAATGEEIWNARYDGPGSGSFFPYDGQGAGEEAISPDGSLYFEPGGSYGVEETMDYVTIAYDTSTGEAVWLTRYHGPGSGSHPSSVAVGQNGNKVFVTGTSLGSDTEADYATIAYYTASGEEVWVARYDGPASGSDGDSYLELSRDGSMVFVTGVSEGIESGDDYATIAYDAETGEEIWIARYDGVHSTDDYGARLTASPDGCTVFVTGVEFYREGPDWTFGAIAYSVLLPIEIDVKPDSETNPINPRSHGVTPVALLGSEEFDVTEVDVTTLRFGPGEAAPAHDLTEAWPHSDPLRDVNRDGFTDLLVHFSTQESGIQCGDTEVALTGQLVDGFPIEGTDTIRTVGCSHKARSKQGQD